MALGKVEKIHDGEDLTKLDRAHLGNVPDSRIAKEGQSTVTYTKLLVESEDPNNPPKETQFLMLHLVVAGWSGLHVNEKLVVADEDGVEIDTFEWIDGADIWTRPLKGNSATFTLRKKDEQDEEPLHSRVGLVDVGLGTVNIFDPNSLDSYVKPKNPKDIDYYGFDTNAGVKWEDVDLSDENIDPVVRQIARRVGLFIYARPLIGGAGDAQRIGHASGVVIEGGRFLTAAHTLMIYHDPQGPGDEHIPVPFAEAHSGSICLNYEVNVNEPVKFYKVGKLIKHGYMYMSDKPITSDVDYVALEIKTQDDALPEEGLPFMPLDKTFADKAQVMIIHHPAGLPKKISRPSEDHPSQIFFPTDIQDKHHYLSWYFSADAVGGTSGAPLFPLGDNHIAGLVTDIMTPWEEGINDSGNFGPRISTILSHWQHEAITEQDAKIALVVDTSGSMQALSGDPADTNQSKLQDAKEALEVFVGMLVADGSHEIALIEFNEGANLRLPMTVYDDVNIKKRIVDEINALVAVPRDETSIGAGLMEALVQLGRGQSLHQKVRIQHILLLTDGIDNKPEAMEEARERLKTTPAQLNIIGFGATGGVEHQELSQLAYETRGYYTYARNGLELKKQYALIYSRIFEAGSPKDPGGVLKAEADYDEPRRSETTRFTVLDEKTLTVIAGWDRYDTTLRLALRDPSGRPVNTSSERSATGNTWTYTRINAPQNGEWSAFVERADHGNDALQLRAHNAPVTAVAYIRNIDEGNLYWAASGAANGAVYLWDVRQANVIQEYYLNETRSDPRVVDLGFYHEGEWLCVAYLDKPLIIWERQTGARLGRYDSAELTHFRCLDISQRFGRLALGGPQGFELLSLESLPPKRVFFFEQHDVRAVAFGGAEGELIAVGGGENGEYIFLFNSLEPEGQIADVSVNEMVNCLAFSPDGAWLVAGHPSGRVSFYQRDDNGWYDLPLEVESPHRMPVTSLAFSPRGDFLFSSSLGYGGDEVPVMVQWPVGDWEAANVLTEEHTNAVLMLDVSLDGAQMLSASADKTLMPWSIEDGEVKPLLNVIRFDERFFISTSARADVHMTPYFRRTNPYYYTGDTYYPQVILRHRLGAQLFPAKMTLIVTSPLQSPGNLLVDAEYSNLNMDDEYGPAILGDRLRPETAMLFHLQKRNSEPLITYETSSYSLFDDGLHYDGAPEPDGLFGNPLPDVLRHEGHYQMRAVASYGDEFQGSREVSWAIYVHIGIDADRTDVKPSDLQTRPNGKVAYIITFTPRDRYGNLMGSGNGERLFPSGPDGASLEGDLIGYRNGDYRQTVVWNSETEAVHGVYIAQPNRDAVWIGRDPEPVTESLPVENGGGRLQPPPRWKLLVERLKVVLSVLNTVFGRWIRRRDTRNVQS